jgi:tetratricopeptide (TPR) repeat protein
MTLMTHDTKTTGTASKAWARFLAMLVLAVGWGTVVGCASKPVPPPPPRAWEEAGRLSRQAALLQSHGDWNGALAWWDRAARQFQLLNDRTNLAMAWHNLGVSHRALGQTQEATDDLERAASLNAALGLTNAWWRNQIALLQVANDSAQPGRSERLMLLDQHPGRPMEGTLGAILAQERARTWMDEGRLPEALTEAERAVAAFAGVGDRGGQAAAHVTLAKILRRLGRHGDAARIWREALAEFEALGDPRGVAVSLAGWGGCLAAEGLNLAQAMDLLKRAEANYRSLGLADEAEALAKEREGLQGGAQR